MWRRISKIEDLLYLVKNMMRNEKNFIFTLDQLNNLINFISITEPVIKTTFLQINSYGINNAVKSKEGIT